MSSKPKVLVVEDDPSNRELFLDLLSMGGYEGIGTDKGEEALGLAKRELPCLVLLDIQLPGVDGLTVVKLLKAEEETKRIKVVALTAYAMRGDKEKFLREGFDGYISKPVMVKEFLGEIKKYLEE
ncbi:MAG: response regulator [Nitrospirales bacterium]|nr:response regulator [Nitrospirales bacterium]